MFPLFRQQLRIWSLWTLAVSALLLANPWAPFGWVELVAAIGPLAMEADRRFGREPVLAIGLPAITLLWIVDPTGASVIRLLLGWAVFGIGVAIGARAIDGQRNLENIAGHVAFAPPDSRAFIAFEAALEQELIRARRHERAFALLSVGVHPESIGFDESGSTANELLLALAENRARLEVHELLLNELRAYSHIVAARGRVLAVVPEAGETIIDAIVKRVRDAANARLGYEIQIGVSRFPTDAICSEDLIAVADEDRTSSKLRPLPDRAQDREDDAAVGIAREV